MLMLVLDCFCAWSWNNFSGVEIWLFGKKLDKIVNIKLISNFIKDNFFESNNFILSKLKYKYLLMVSFCLF